MAQEREVNTNLQEKLPLEKNGYYDITNFVDTTLGFSFKKNFRTDQEHVSLFHLLVENNDYNNPELERKPLFLSVVYGKKTPNGVTMRGFDPKAFGEPVDLDFRDEYFYNPGENKLYNKSGEEISGEELLRQIYDRHIKTTKLFLGFFSRLKLSLWRVWIPAFLGKISDLLHWILYLVSGDRYTYRSLFDEEKLNGIVISSRMPYRVNDTISQKTSVEQPAKEVEFFGIKVAQWPIIFYALLHLSFWFSLNYIYYPTESIEKFLGINFLTVLYVIVSFWIVDIVIPFFLKKAIKLASTLADRAQHRRISI